MIAEAYPGLFGTFSVIVCTTQYVVIKGDSMQNCQASSYHQNFVTGFVDMEFKIDGTSL